MIAYLFLIFSTRLKLLMISPFANTAAAVKSGACIPTNVLIYTTLLNKDEYYTTIPAERGLFLFSCSKHAIPRNECGASYGVTNDIPCHLVARKQKQSSFSFQSSWLEQVV